MDNNLFTIKMIDDQVISLKEAIFWLIGVLAFGTFRFLAWIMPKTAEVFYQHVKKVMLK